MLVYRGIARIRRKGKLLGTFCMVKKVANKIFFYFCPFRCMQRQYICVCVLILCDYLLTYLLTPWSRVLLEKLTGSAASQEIPHIFEPEGSLPYSQVPDTCPYPEPTPCSPHNPLALPEDPS